MLIIGESMNVMCDKRKVKDAARSFINANVWDGEDRAGCDGDICNFTPNELQELIDDLIDHLYEDKP